MLYTEICFACGPFSKEIYLVIDLLFCFCFSCTQLSHIYLARDFTSSLFKIIKDATYTYFAQQTFQTAFFLLSKVYFSLPSFNNIFHYYSTAYNRFFSLTPSIKQCNIKVEQNHTNKKSLRCLLHDAPKAICIKPFYE